MVSSANLDAFVALDPVMAGLAAAHGPPSLHKRRRGRNHFEELAESICYQQLAGRAAETIWGRVRALVDGPFTAEAVVALAPGTLRAAGCSNAKATAITDLAEKVVAGQVHLSRTSRLSDEQVISELITVRGIGRWTAEMFLMFTLGRLDVWPILDLGVRTGYARAYGLVTAPTTKELGPLGDRFRPYRSLAAWYCWRAAETITPNFG